MPHPIRYLLFVFVIFMAAGLGSCRTEEQPEFGMATFQCDVTPPEGTLIYSGYEPLAEVEHPLLAKGIVIDSGLPHSSRIGAAMSLSTLEREDKPYILSALRINDSWIVNLPGECMIDFQFFLPGSGAWWICGRSCLWRWRSRIYLHRSILRRRRL